MSELMKFLTIMPTLSKKQGRGLERLCTLLPSPLTPLHGRRGAPLALPDNIICFCRRNSSDLNRPERGRALHNRYVLILALETTVSVCIDDRAIRLQPNEGVLVLPFQFHDYTEAAKENLKWLFVTFELFEAGSLEALKYRPFKLTHEVYHAATDLVDAYLGKLDSDLVSLLLGVLLSRIRQADPIKRRQKVVSGSPRLIMQVDRLAQGTTTAPSIKWLASELGISSSHLRARFRASCGVSIGKHLRSLRLEKACGLLRMSQNRVTEIAETCGFTSIYRFSRAFHSTYGVSPLQYRREDRKPYTKK